MDKQVYLGKRPCVYCSVGGLWLNGRSPMGDLTWNNKLCWCFHALCCSGYTGLYSLFN